MDTKGLTIRCPVYCEEKAHTLKLALTYLETPHCRATMSEKQRRETIQKMTAQFRHSLVLKERVS